MQQFTKALAGLAFTCAIIAAGDSAYAQGCVASRCPVGGAASGMAHYHEGQLPPGSGFQLSVGYRWLHSDRHFVGSDEQEDRQEEGSEVINDSHFVDVSLTYAFTPRTSLTLTVPYSLHERSQVVRDADRNILNRFETQSFGLGDLRLVGNYWALDPTRPRRGNVLLGLGVDVPTGQDDATDTFQVFDAATGQIRGMERTVDQSIQPGDGGWGIILELYAYRQIVERWNVYGSASYTITPEETNGVPTFRSNPFEAEMSIADTYVGRAGVEYLLWPKYGVTVGLGGRVEGVPVHDVIGRSEGFRRPGYAISVEPSVSVMIEQWTAAVQVPIAVYRNRQRSVPDEQSTDATGVFRHGDAAFADYLVMLSVSKRF